MTAKAKKPEPEYDIEKLGENEFKVRKLVNGVLEAEYTVSQGSCTCRGWRFRQDCKHVQMVYQPQPSGIELPQARKFLSEILEEFEPLVDQIWKEEYVRDESGRITEIILHWTQKPDDRGENPKKIQGVYKGLVRVTLVKVSA